MEAEQIQTDENTALILEVESTKAIQSADHYRHVATLRGLIKDMIKDHEQRAKPRIDEANQHVKNLRADLAKLTDPLNEQFKKLGGLLVVYDQEQEKQKRQREMELEAEQRRKAEQERQELVNLAKQMGDKDLAKEIKSRPIEVAPVVVVKDTPTAKETNVSFREDWKFRILNETKIPREYMMVDEVKIGKIIRALKGSSNIEGIQVYSIRVPIQR
jgi:hypothetical protein